MTVPKIQRKKNEELQNVSEEMEALVSSNEAFSKDNCRA